MTFLRSMKTYFTAINFIFNLRLFKLSYVLDRFSFSLLTNPTVDLPQGTQVESVPVDVGQKLPKTTQQKLSALQATCPTQLD